MEGVWDLSLEERRIKSKVHGVMARKGFGSDTLKVISVLYSKRFRSLLVSDTVSVVKLAHSQYDHTSAFGFCLGEGLSLKVASRVDGLSSAVSFYGEPPMDAEVKRISSPMLVIHAAYDEITNSKVQEFVGAVMAPGKDLTLKVYPGTRHGFFNDTNSSVCGASAAEEAWEFVTQFLQKTL